MEVGIHANMYDNETEKIASILDPVFEELGKRLSGDYGGIIEHLWIDFELIESRSRENGNPKYPFRFQKRVSGYSRFGLPAIPDRYNVGHFSVRPDYTYLKTLKSENVANYALNIIYNGMAVLKEKEKKLGGFQTDVFINKFCDECHLLGYSIKT